MRATDEPATLYLRVLITDSTLRMGPDILRLFARKAIRDNGASVLSMLALPILAVGLLLGSLRCLGRLEQYICLIRVMAQRQAVSIAYCQMFMCSRLSDPRQARGGRDFASHSKYV